MLDQQHVSVAKAALTVFGMAPKSKSPDSQNLVQRPWYNIQTQRCADAQASV